MIDRITMLGIPPIAIGLTAAVLLGPGATRPALGARIYGAPAGPGLSEELRSQGMEFTGHERERARHASLRIVTVTSLYGVDEVVAVPDLAVSEGGETRWSGASASDGVAEALWVLDPSGPDKLELSVTGRGRSLAHTILHVSRVHRLEILKANLSGPKRGDIGIQVEADRGTFAVPFRGSLTLALKDDVQPDMSDAKVSVSATGAAVARVTEPTREGHVVCELTPTFHVIDVEIDVVHGDRTGHWEGSLPIVLGAMDVEKAGGDRLRVVSPVERERAYLSFWAWQGRRAGAVVPLARGADGSWTSAPFEPPSGAAAVTVSSDPLEASVGTVTWPLVQEGRPSPPQLELLIDGVPQAIAAEHARAWRVRRWGLLVLAAAALAEILLLVARGRRAQAELEAHLAAASDEPRATAMRAAQSPAAYWALASAGLIAFSFAIVAALAAFR